MSTAVSKIKTMKFVALACLAMALLLCLLIDSSVGHGQENQRGQDQSDVLRVYTEIVQTDVMVFDKQGRFVDGLKSSDFELRIDGTPKQVEFFEKVTAGSINEEMQLAAARGSARAKGPSATGPAPLDRGRPIFFYVDDLHLDLAAWQATQKLIKRFIDKEMGQNDEAAIASASGQIGFLQQLTDNKAVLRMALERLKVKPYLVRDFERPTMTEYQALLVNNYDHDLTNFFIDATIRLNPGMPRDMAESLVTTRARALAQQSGMVAINTLSGLEGLIKSAHALPGRKLIFFISGGFFLDDRASDSRSRLQRITSAAARTGVVIYSMDARGLVASLGDISTQTEFDISGTLQRANSAELHASQDSLYSLAADTGGKSVINTNSLEPGLGRALKETSTYYLLAWKPDRESQQSKFRRIEVKVVGRPDLTVQVRRGFFDREPEAAKATKSEKPGNEKKAGEMSKAPDAELQKEILAAYPERDIPVALNLTYLNNPPKGMMLSAALQVDNEFFSFVPSSEKHTAMVTVAGSVFDDKGNVGARFSDRLTIQAPSLAAIKDGRDLVYGYPVYVKPGLYQVRVGVRDETTGRSGTAHGWIEIPDLSNGQVALSSLMLGSRTVTPVTTNASAISDTPPNPVTLSIDHRFPAEGFLRFMILIYNAALAPADSKPDVAVQVQIVRDEQPVTTSALKKITVEGVPDVTKIPYAAEVSLKGLPAGRYLLQFTVVDRVSKTSASQQSRFEIN